QGGGLGPQTVANLLGAAPPLVRETAAWIAGRHPEWGDALAGYLRSRLADNGLSEADAAELEGQLARFAKSASVQDLMARSVCDIESSRAARGIVLRAMARAALKEPPGAWLAALAELLAGDDAQLLEQAVL